VQLLFEHLLFINVGENVRGEMPASKCPRPIRSI